MSPYGDGIYCHLFVERERQEVPVGEALSSHSPWPRREPGTCLPFCQDRRGDGMDLGPCIPWHVVRRSSHLDPTGEGGLWACLPPALSKSGILNSTSRISPGT